MRKALWIALIVAGGVSLAWAGEPNPPEGPPPRGPQAEPPPGERGQPQRPMPGDMMRRMAEFAGIPPNLVMFWREVDPDFLTDLRELTATRPEEAREAMARAMGEMRELQELKGRDPEAFDLAIQRRRLGRQVHKLGARLRAAKTQPEKEPIALELRSTLDRLFDVIAGMRDREIKSQEERAKELRELNKKWRDNKADMIEHRVKELSSELDYLKW